MAITHLTYNGKLFEPYEYPSEAEFEQDVIAHSTEIFGEHSIYFDVKKKIGVDNIVTIPDGYLIDFFFDRDPSLYIVENELSSHDPYKHIGQQLLKFAISYKSSGRQIKAFLMERILADTTMRAFVEEHCQQAGFRNIDALLESIIFDKSVAAIVLIDEVTNDLESVLHQLTMKTDILELRAYGHGDQWIYQYTPFQQELREVSGLTGPSIDPDELDTIVVAANEEGFIKAFLGENCWYAIRMSSAMLDRVKYIAAYQTAPVSAITYWAVVNRIERYKETNKYIVYFNGSATKFQNPIKLPPDSGKKGLAPQAPRYTSYDRLMKAKTMAEVF